MKTVSLKIDERVVHRLMASGHLCAADFKCLDCESKECIWRIALKNTTGLRVPQNEPKLLHRTIKIENEL